MRVVDPTQEERARAEAFLRVPLYKAIYEKYKGYTLPPAAALEREMAGLGVSSKQTDKARQAFDRSARQAGFFWSGNDRLVAPPLKSEGPGSRPIDAGSPGAPAKENELPNNGSEGSGRTGGSGSGRGGGTGNAVVDALIASLPASGTKWEVDQRINWLTMIAMAFNMAYQPIDEAISISKSKTTA